MLPQTFTTASAPSPSSSYTEFINEMGGSASFVAALSTILAGLTVVSILTFTKVNGNRDISL